MFFSVDRTTFSALLRKMQLGICNEQMIAIQDEKHVMGKRNGNSYNIHNYFNWEM